MLQGKTRQHSEGNALARVQRVHQPADH
jgi:hypothetical protein